MADTASNSAQRSIKITYDLVVPASSECSLPTARTVDISAGSDLRSLSTALDEARNETNSTLTQWKNAIGEAEKQKEALAAQRALEAKKAKKISSKAGQTADAAADSDDSEDEDGEEE